MKIQIQTSLCDGESWFKDLSAKAQQHYLELHPHSHFGKLAHHTVGKLATTVKDLHKEQHEFFHGEGHKPGSQPRRKMGQFLKDKLHGALKVVKHEGHEFKLAGHAVAALAHGKKLDEHHKAALKKVLMDTAMVVAPIAISGGLSLGLAHCLPHIAGGFIEHLVMSAATKAAVFAMNGMQHLLPPATIVHLHNTTNNEITNFQRNCQAAEILQAEIARSLSDYGRSAH